MSLSLEQGSVSVPFVNSFIAFSDICGVSRDDLLNEARVSSDLLHDDENRISLASFHQISQAGKKLSGDPALLLRFASHADFSEISVAGLIANASATMYDALVQLNRYGRLAIDAPYIGDRSLAFEAEPENDFVVDKRVPSSWHSDLIEISFTYLITGPRAFLPRPHIVDVELTREPPAYRDLFFEIWGCPVKFGGERNAIRFPKWVASHPVGLQPEYVIDILRKHADGLLKDFEIRSVFAARLERLIASELHTGEVSIDWAALRLNLSRQSIYRRLKAEGTTFEKLLDKVRHQLALVYLLERKLTVFETAFLLGFSDPSPFSRAFKRWTGRAPASFAKTPENVG